MDEQCSTLFNSFINMQNLMMSNIIELKNEQKLIREYLEKIAENIELEKEKINDIYEKIESINLSLDIDEDIIQRG